MKICKHCLNCGKQDKLRILFKESKSIILLGSLPNIDKYTCSCHLNYPSECYGDSCGSTESVLNEADDFLHELVDKHLFTQKKHTNISEYVLKQLHDRCSENDLKFGEEEIYYNTKKITEDETSTGFQILFRQYYARHFCQHPRNV